MKEEKAGKIFRAVYGKDPNFMTPDVIEYGAAGKYVYELSKGTGIGGGMLYGVSVVDAYNRTRTDAPLSQCFFTLADARAHIASLAQPEGE